MIKLITISLYMTTVLSVTCNNAPERQGIRDVSQEIQAPAQIGVPRLQEALAAMANVQEAIDALERQRDAINGFMPMLELALAAMHLVEIVHREPEVHAPVEMEDVD